MLEKMLVALEFEVPTRHGTKNLVEYFFLLNNPHESPRI
jgi:hypothetical protein